MEKTVSGTLLGRSGVSVSDLGYFDSFDFLKSPQ